MARRRRKEGEHVDEAWAVPMLYFMTVLCALFIALFAMSSLDAQKFQAMAHSFNVLLTGGTGIQEYDSPIELPPNPNMEEEESDIESHNSQERSSLEKLKAALDQYISDNNLGDSLNTELSDEGLMIVITSDVLFDPGSAKVKGQSYYLAKEISTMLEDTRRMIVVSGHTDNIPMNSQLYRSNWDLSVARAVNFMDLMINQSSLSESQFTVKGYGEFKPVDTNDTSEGRDKNRRVEVLVLPNYIKEQE